MSSEMTTRDKKLLDAAADGLSGEEMAERMGISAAECLVQVKRILKSRDVWTEAERRQLMMHDLYRLKNQLQKQTENYVDDKSAGALIKTVKALSEIMEKMSTLTEEEMARVSQAHARTMVMLIVDGFSTAKRYLELEFPDVPVREVEKRLHEGLRIAMEKVEVDE